MKLFEVTATDRGREVVLEVEATTKDAAKRRALEWLPAGAKVIGMKDTLFRSSHVVYRQP